MTAIKYRYEDVEGLKVFYGRETRRRASRVRRSCSSSPSISTP
jgi:hypothetical protein